MSRHVGFQGYNRRPYVSLNRPRKVRRRMLNPSQVAQLRKMFDGEEFVSIFEGMHVRRQEINVSRHSIASKLLFSEASDSGQLYPPARIFGVPIEPSCLSGTAACTISPPTRTVRELRNSCIVGNSAVLDSESRLYFPDPVDGCAAFVACKREVGNNHHGYLVRGDELGAEIIHISRPTPRYIPVRVIFFHNLEPGNYGSFLIRQLPQMSLIAELGIHADAYVVPDRTSWLGEAIELFGLPDLPTFTVREVCGDVFESVVLPGSLDAEGFSSPISRLRISNQISGRLGESAGDNPKRIFVSRLLSSIARPYYRVLLNELDVIKLADARGYHTLYPETLSLSNQINIFRSAECIVGPSGSGMLNALFSERRPRILDLESWTPNVRQHAKIYASTGSTYGFLFGQTIGDSDRPVQVRGWKVDTDLLDQALNWVEETRYLP
jgi:hypothetical protein